MDLSPQFQILSVKVTPRASRNCVQGWADTEQNTLLLKVTAPAEGGKANAAVVKLLADELNIPKGAVTIKQGKTSRYKLIALDVAPETLQVWLRQL